MSGNVGNRPMHQKWAKTSEITKNGGPQSAAKFKSEKCKCPSLSLTLRAAIGREINYGSCTSPSFSLTYKNERKRRKSTQAPEMSKNVRNYQKRGAEIGRKI